MSSSAGGQKAKAGRVHPDQGERTTHTAGAGAEGRWYKMTTPWHRWLELSISIVCAELGMLGSVVCVGVGGGGCVCIYEAANSGPIYSDQRHVRSDGEG